MQKIDVLGIGHALVDMQVQVEDRRLAQLQFEKGIMTLIDPPTQIRVLDGLRELPVHRCAGGSAANTVIGIAEFGGKAAFVGKVARDPLGEFFLQDLRDLGVGFEVAPGAGQTGTSTILITSDAQRTMLTCLGVSTSIGPDDVLEEQIRRAKFVYIEGYLFSGSSSREAALKVISLAKTNHVKVAFTVSDPFLIHNHREEFWKLIKGPVDLLFCNLEEARSLTGQHDPIACAQEIHRHASDVALTLGAEGSLLMHNQTVTPIEGISVEAVDSTGAGDMYAAGILYGITNGLSWKQAGHLASHAAARIVGQLGARLHRKFTPEEIRTFSI